MSYTITPFYNNILLSKVYHSNQEQTIEIYRTFRRLGYTVDIIDHRDPPLFHPPITIFSLEWEKMLGKLHIICDRKP